MGQTNRPGLAFPYFDQAPLYKGTLWKLNTVARLPSNLSTAGPSHFWLGGGKGSLCNHKDCRG